MARTLLFLVAFAFVLGVLLVQDKPEPVKVYDGSYSCSYRHGVVVCDIARAGGR